MDRIDLLHIAAGLPDFHLIEMLEKALIQAKRTRNLEHLAAPCTMIMHKVVINHEGFEKVQKALNDHNEAEAIRQRMNSN